MEKAEVFLEWERPKEAGFALSKRALQRGLRMFFVMFVAVAIVLVIYWDLPKLPVNEMGFGFGIAVLIFVLYSIVVCLLGFIYVPFSLRYTVLYQLSDKGIYERSRSNKMLLAWKTIEDYSLIDDTIVPDFHTIRYKVSGHERSLILPTKELADEVLEMFEERVERKEHTTIVKLSRWHVCFLLTLCAVYAGVCLYILKTHPDAIPFPKGYLLLVSLLFGPGTIGMACLVGLKCVKIRGSVSMAVLFNFIGMLLWGFFALIVEYMTLSKFFNSG